MSILKTNFLLECYKITSSWGIHIRCVESILILEGQNLNKTL